MKTLKMMMTLFCLIPAFAFADAGKTKIEDVQISAVDQNSKGNVIIRLAGPLNEIPELTVKDNIVQVAVPNSFVWPKIEKDVTLGSTKATLMAYQFNKDLVRVRAVLPYSLQGKEKQVSLVVNEKTVELVFPVMNQDQTVVAPVAKPKKDSKNYDTNYLEKLLSDKELKEIARKANETTKTIEVSSETTPARAPTNAEDKVNVTLSATDRDVNAPFSLANYLGKFVAFLGIVLLLFYAVANVMKKGMLKKGKLGFLNSTKAVEVLSTTFVGPKRSVMLIRAHDQVFLVGSSENGLQFLSEVKNPAGLMKEGERALAGNNFDTEMTSTPAKEFRIKEDPRQMAQTEEVSLDNFLDSKATSKVKDKVRFSDQIKSKVKTLKPLQ